jgi:hypothetical protein
MKYAAFLVCAFLAVSEKLAATDSVFITEFMAMNGGTDSDGDKSDWNSFHVVLNGIRATEVRTGGFERGRW